MRISRERAIWGTIFATIGTIGAFAGVYGALVFLAIAAFILFPIRAS